jgi:hypothetical protein
MKNFLVAFTLVATLLLTTGPSQAGHDQLVAGAGPSTKVAELFFAEFCKDPACADYHFTIMQTSVKHKGGILSSSKYLFGRTGRPLTAEEKELGKEEILLGRVPITFAVGLETGVKQLSLKQAEQIFNRKITNWKQLGGKDATIILVGREETEALYSVLKKEYPRFRNLAFDKVFKKDHQVVKFLNSPAGAHAISFGAKPNFNRYNLLKVKGFSAGVALGLVYDLENRNHPIIKAAAKYAAGAAWKKQLKTLDMLPVD